MSPDRSLPKLSRAQRRLLAVMVRAVRAGGRIVRRHFASGALEVRQKSSPGDLVSNVDLEVQQRVIGLLAHTFPGVDVVSEEKENPREPSEAFYLDPLDGTLNFLHQLQPFAVSLAYWRGGQPQAAAVYDPLSRELYTALRGGGARRGGRPLAVSPVDSLGQALVGAGWPYARAERTRLLAQMERVYLAAQELRTIGSASLALCRVAAGAMDAYWERGLHAWDMAAGALLVEEAGGRVSALDGGPFQLHSGEVLASNGRIHEEMVRTLED